jgi:hypothetical protein
LYHSDQMFRNFESVSLPGIVLLSHSDKMFNNLMPSFLTRDCPVLSY